MGRIRFPFSKCSSAAEAAAASAEAAAASATAVAAASRDVPAKSQLTFSPHVTVAELCRINYAPRAISVQLFINILVRVLTL